MKSEIIDLVMLTYGNGITSQVSVIEVNDDKFLGSCTKLSGDLDLYEVRLKKTGDPFVDLGVKAHEFGHIYLNQLDIYEDLSNKVRETIEKNRELLSKRINQNCKIDYGDELLERIITDQGSNNFIHNIAMDLEVNSKILSFDDIRKIEDFLNKGDKSSNIKLVYPDDYTLPSGSTFPKSCSYPEYLVLVIQNLDQFLNRFIFDSCSSLDLDQVLESMGEYSNEIEKGCNGENDSGDSKDSNDDINSSEVLEISDTDLLDIAIDEILLRSKKKIQKKNYRKDLLYLYNRGINRTVICPAYRLQRDIRKKFGIVFLVDVSSSMDRKLVSRIITTIGKKMGKIRSDLEYSIVCWSTYLSSEYRGLSKGSSIPKIRVGGGTRLATGISYIDQEYPKSDILIIISDFNDDLFEWELVTSKINDREIYGFIYGNSTKDSIKIKNIKIKG